MAINWATVVGDKICSFLYVFLFFTIFLFEEAEVGDEHKMLKIRAKGMK